MNDVPAIFRHDHATGVRVRLDDYGRVSTLAKHTVAGRVPVSMSHAAPATIAIMIDGVSYPISPDLFVSSGPTPGA